MTKNSGLDHRDNPAVSPLPRDIKVLRLLNNLTQTQASEMIYRNCRAWQRWESGDAKMDPAIWELFVLKVKLIGW